MGEYCKDKDYRLEETEEEADHEQHDSLRPFEKSAPALNRRRLSPGPGIRYYGDTDSSKKSNCRKDGIAAIQKMDEDAEHDEEVGIAVEHGIKEASEGSHHSCAAGDSAVEEVE